MAPRVTAPLLLLALALCATGASAQQAAVPIPKPLASLPVQREFVCGARTCSLRPCFDPFRKKSRARSRCVARAIKIKHLESQQSTSQQHGRSCGSERRRRPPPAATAARRRRHSTHSHDPFPLPHKKPAAEPIIQKPLSGLPARPPVDINVQPREFFARCCCCCSSATPFRPLPKERARGRVASKLFWKQTFRIPAINKARAILVQRAPPTPSLD